MGIHKDKQKVHIWINKDILASASAYVEATDEINSITALVGSTLKTVLKEKGFYPPPENNLSEQLEPYRKLGVVDETALRNIEMVKKFQQGRQNGIRAGILITELAEEYNIGEKAVSEIVYRKKPRKKWLINGK